MEKVFGDYIVLKEQPTKDMYDELKNRVMEYVYQFIESSGKQWKIGKTVFVEKSRDEIPRLMKEETDIGTLGCKVYITR